MNKKEYKEYQERVNKFFKREGINNLSLEDGEESFFTSQPCECCNRELGGDRYHCSGYNPQTEDTTCYDVCWDCLYYAEYGHLDDMQMLDIERETVYRIE